MDDPGTAVVSRTSVGPDDVAVTANGYGGRKERSSPAVAAICGNPASTGPG
jgi:hypothetical protein